MWRWSRKKTHRMMMTPQIRTMAGSACQTSMASLTEPGTKRDEHRSVRPLQKQSMKTRNRRRIKTAIKQRNSRMERL
jgi:hypothetical protein